MDNNVVSVAPRPWHQVAIGLLMTTVLLDEGARHQKYCPIHDHKVIRTYHGSDVAKAIFQLQETGISLTGDDKIIFGRASLDRLLGDVILALTDDTVAALLMLPQFPTEKDSYSFRGSVKMQHFRGGNLRHHFYLKIIA
jgi:hypothetical protein